jgi:hypothetical protein
MNEAEKFTANLASQAAKAAGEEFRAGNYDKAWALTQEARDLDPSRNGLWDAHESRIKLAESQSDIPLDELLQRRLERAGITPDDPSYQLWARHNEALQDREIGE